MDKSKIKSFEDLISLAKKYPSKIPDILALLDTDETFIKSLSKSQFSLERLRKNIKELTKPIKL